MTIYTKVPKPSPRTYTNVNPQGREQYDEASVMYDDPNTFYDGTDVDMWTKVAKPSSGQLLATAGLYYGFGSFTYSGGQVLQDGSNWTKVPKPN